MSDAADEDPERSLAPGNQEPPRPWPPDLVVSENNRVDATCAACGATWNVHRTLASFRFSCAGCGAWVQVAEAATGGSPRLRAGNPLDPPATRDGRDGQSSAPRPVEEMPLDSAGLVTMDLPLGRLYEGEIPVNLPMAPGALRHVEVKVRQSWTNRTILEIVAMVAALVAPHAAFLLLMSERNAERLMPLATMIGGILVLLVGLSAPQYAFNGLRAARPRYFLETVLVWGLSVALAVAWTAAVRGMVGESAIASDEWGALAELLGVPLLIAVMAIGPALFEELAFRGLFQGRLSALLGRSTGIAATAAFFALAHGISWASPIHLALGVYLGLLRDRSGSLLPGMLLHFLYNASLVLIYVAAG